MMKKGKENEKGEKRKHGKMKLIYCMAHGLHLEIWESGID